jgi:hypothetical protein
LRWIAINLLQNCHVILQNRHRFAARVSPVKFLFVPRERV